MSRWEHWGTIKSVNAVRPSGNEKHETPMSRAVAMRVPGL
jgi:hypothetical protein